MRAARDIAGSRRVRAALAAVAAPTAAMRARTPQPAGGASASETQFSTTGRWAVRTANASYASASYGLFYPTNGGAGGVDHAIVTWGNGTNATPSQYSGLLTHLA